MPYTHKYGKQDYNYNKKIIKLSELMWEVSKPQIDCLHCTFANERLRSYKRHSIRFLFVPAGKQKTKQEKSHNFFQKIK